VNATPCLKPQEFLKGIAIKLLAVVVEEVYSAETLVLLEFPREIRGVSLSTPRLYDLGHSTVGLWTS
jgi:hypothetical protein